MIDRQLKTKTPLRISVKEARKLLPGNGKRFTDDEVQAMVQLLQEIAFDFIHVGSKNYH